MRTKVRYNNRNIAFSGGENIKVNCKGKYMRSDVSVSFDDDTSGSVTYEGTTTEVERGKSVTYECKKTKMLDDIVIRATAVEQPPVITPPTDTPDTPIEPPEVLPELSAPVINIWESYLSIADTSGLNPDFAIKFEGGKNIGVVETNSTYYDLSILNLPTGDYTIRVKARLEGYVESENSNAVIYSNRPPSPFPAPKF